MRPLIPKEENYVNYACRICGKMEHEENGSWNQHPYLFFCSLKCHLEWESKRKPHEKLGNVGRAFCYIFDAWIVGGGANYIAGKDLRVPKDIDILIPLNKWVEACKIIPKDSKINSFGGAKFIDSNGIIIDVWTDDLGAVMMNTPHKPVAYQPKKQIYLKVE